MDMADLRVKAAFLIQMARLAVKMTPNKIDDDIVEVLALLFQDETFLRLIHSLLELRKTHASIDLDAALVAALGSRLL